MASVQRVDETIWQVFVAPLGNAKARALDDRVRLLANILDEQSLQIEAARIPVLYLQAECLAQQGLPCAQALRRTWSAEAVGIVALHGGERSRRR